MWKNQHYSQLAEGVGFGHKSLSFLLRFARENLSVRDPDSAGIKIKKFLSASVFQIQPPLM